MPNRKSLSDIRASILRPAMTSQFMAYIDFPQTVKTYLSKNKGLTNPQGTVLTGGLNLACTEASLPGSSLATLELTGDHTGVTERHVHRRMFDERIDLTFYVDAAEYLPIRAFEFWKEYIVSGNSGDNPPSPPSLSAADYYHRMKYPDSYITGAKDNGGGLRIVKFERDFDGSFRGNGPRTVNGTGNGIIYNFVRVFPIAVASMPVSYEASSLLKCTVSLSYVRYFLEGALGDSDSTTSPSPQVSTTPALTQQEITRNDTFGNTAGPGTLYGERDTATGALLNGRSDGPLLTTRQVLGLDPI
tara:strand:+ start:1219 stop:2124 length:906 start_codon:yes stop_codon:yes gene_type:complete